MGYKIYSFAYSPKLKGVLMFIFSEYVSPTVVAMRSEHRGQLIESGRGIQLNLNKEI